MEEEVSRPTKKQWSFLAYIAGDNDLSDNGVEDIEELCEVGASDKLHVGVEIDKIGEHTGSIRYEITEPDWSGKAHSTVIERLPEKDAGDPDTLRSFLKWGIDRYPADNRIVVVWGHGSGFRSVRRDIGYDDFGSSLDLPEIVEVFNRSGIGKNNKISILGFDACLMNMIEIANHFRDHAEILVGSQQTEPGDGWPYDKVLEAIKNSPDNTNISKQIVSEYVNNYKKKGVHNVTQSAIEISKTDAVIEALSELGNVLTENIYDYHREIKKARRESQAFKMADYVDLIHMSRLISEHTEKKEPIMTATNAVIKTTSACILASDKFGDVVRNAEGLSVWFPSSAISYDNYRSKYLALRCNEHGSGWMKFLDAYHD